MTDPQHQPERRFYRWWARNWHAGPVFAGICLILAALLILAIISGCAQSQTREESQTEKADTITVTGSITVPTADGPRAVPVSITVDRKGTESEAKQSDTRSGIDGAAIGREIATAIGPVIGAAVQAGGVPWAQILGGVGTATVAATTGYLALKKREQLRPERRKP